MGCPRASNVERRFPSHFEIPVMITEDYVDHSGHKTFRTQTWSISALRCVVDTMRFRIRFSIGSFPSQNDLVEVRSGATSYGTIIFGKIRLPAVKDEQGEGYVHVRCVLLLIIDKWRLKLPAPRIHDPPNRVRLALEICSV